MVYSAIVFTLLIVIVGAIQSALGDYCQIRQVKPDFLLCLVVGIGLLRGPIAGTVAGFGAGLIQGAMQGMWMSGFALSKTVAGYLAGQLSGIMFKENLLVPVVSTLVLSLAHEAIFCIFAGPAPWLDSLRISLERSAYNAAIAPFIFLGLKQIDRRLPRPGHLASRV